MLQLSILIALVLATVQAQTNAGSTCVAPYQEVPVQGITDPYCVQAPVCEATNNDGACPPQDTNKLLNGSYCGLIGMKNYGCKPGSAPVCTQGKLVFVNGADDTFCTMDLTVCDNTNPAGACPPISDQLREGSYCGLIGTDEYACINGTAPICPNDGVMAFVEGTSQAFCTKGTSADCCSGSNHTGLCPYAQEGLENGSSCQQIDKARDLWGCLKYTPTTAPTATETTSPPTPTNPPETAAPPTTTNPPETTAPPTTTNPPETTAPPTTINPPTTSPVPTKDPWHPLCPPEQRVSVEGKRGYFCVDIPVCSGDQLNNEGNCPGKDKHRLPHGSYCGFTRTNKYGCLAHPGKGLEANSTYGTVKDCSKSKVGNVPVSVIGAPEESYCTSDKKQQICADDVKGACPTKESGLAFDSVCVRINVGTEDETYACTMSSTSS